MPAVAAPLPAFDSAVQFADGRIDDGSVHAAPDVYLGDDPLSSVQARELAAALIETADEVDRWSAHNQPSHKSSA